MADTPKRKKLEKNTDACIQVPSSQKFYCCRCGMSYSRMKGFFPVSHSPMYRGSGFIPMCNDCIESLYDQYRTKLGSDEEAMKRICMKLDLYWNKDIYTMVERTSGVRSRVRNYIGKTNIIRYIDKTFDDTLDEEALAQSEEPAPVESPTEERPQELPEPEPVEIEVDQSIIDFWGTGYTPDFYMELERRYDGWTAGKEVNDPSERSLYQQVCLLETIISRDASQGKPIDKNVNALNAVLGSMNLKPAQKKNDADAELEKMPLGVGIQKWEYSRPLPETPKEKRDIRGTIKNITTWYLGHACKMVGLRNSYCKMYEDAMEELRVKHPEYDEDDDDSFLNDIFGASKVSGDT